MPPKFISLRTNTSREHKDRNQTLDIFRDDSERRIPNDKFKTVLLYYWMPISRVSTISTKEWTKTLRDLVALGNHYFPKLRFLAMSPMMELELKSKENVSINSKSKVKTRTNAKIKTTQTKINDVDTNMNNKINNNNSMTVKYRGDTFWNASSLLDMIPPLPTEPDESSSSSSSSSSLLSTLSPSSVYARLVITSQALVTRNTMLVAGLARRSSGLACYSLSHNSAHITFIHEFAHLLGLHHCPVTTCIMVAGSDGPIMTKSKTTRSSSLSSSISPTIFCIECQTKIDIACSLLT
jgi:hypothetical protein